LEGDDERAGASDRSGPVASGLVQPGRVSDVVVVGSVVVVVGSVVLVVVVVGAAVVVVVAGRVVLVVVVAGRVVVVVVAGADVAGAEVVVVGPSHLGSWRVGRTSPVVVVAGSVVVVGSVVLEVSDVGTAELVVVDQRADGAEVVEDERSTVSPRTCTWCCAAGLPALSTTRARAQAATTIQNHRPSRTNCTARRYRSAPCGRILTTGAGLGRTDCRLPAQVRSIGERRAGPLDDTPDERRCAHVHRGLLGRAGRRQCRGHAPGPPDRRAVRR
jgi:hypothetical protein